MLEGQCSDTPGGFFLLIRVNMQLSKQSLLTPEYLTLILRRYYTLFGLRMSYLDSAGGKRELAGEKRNTKHVLIKLQY